MSRIFSVGFENANISSGANPGSCFSLSASCLATLNDSFSMTSYKVLVLMFLSASLKAAWGADFALLDTGDTECALLVKSLPGQIIQSLPGQIVRSLPGQIVRSLPGQIISSLPGQIISAQPGQVVKPLPGQIKCRMLPWAMNLSKPIRSKAAPAVN